MKVIVGPFALWGIKTQAGSDPGAGIETAVTHYARRLKSGKPPGDIPRFRRGTEDQEDQDAEEGRVFHLAVDSETEAALKREAARQGTSVNRLVDHTIMVFLADMELAEPTFSLS